MSQQLHKRFTDEEVKDVFCKYHKQALTVQEAARFLRVKERQFFVLLGRYRQSPATFTVGFKRAQAPRRIDERSEKKILGELKKEATLIADERNPIRFFNYSYVKELLQDKHGVQVSLPTIISRAKKMGITKRKRFAKFTTDRC